MKNREREEEEEEERFGGETIPLSLVAVGNNLRRIYSNTAISSPDAFQLETNMKTRGEISSSR